MSETDHTVSIQIRPDDIRENFINRENSRKERYAEYLNQNNLDDTYTPSQGDIYLKSQFLIYSFMQGQT